MSPRFPRRTPAFHPARRVRLAVHTARQAIVATACALAASIAAAQPLPPPFTVAGPGAPALPATIAQALIDSGLPLSAVSLWVQAVDSNAPRLALQAEAPRQMASVMKLVTTGVALRTLGPAYRWHTAAALDGRLDTHGVLGGNVHLKASGDPSLDAMRLAEALRGWRQAGLREIRGDVVVDRSLFALPSFDAAAFDGQPLKPYNAGPDTWLLAHGAVSLTLRPDPARPAGVHVGLSPALAGVKLDARLTLDRQAPCGDWREALQLDIDPGLAERRTARTVHLRGRYPAACQDQTWALRWPQAAEGEHSARVFEAAWEDAGGRLSGQVRDGPWPAEPTPWMDWLSPPLAEVVRDINKFSNNVMARQLFLTLGLDADAGRATLDTARMRVAEQVRLATRSGGAGPCEGIALQLDNGSGLSRAETASAHCMARWVQVMWTDPLMPEWLASLPVAGVDGTARRMGAATGRAHLKTGSLDGVASIAGVVQDLDERRWVVVAVVNDPRANAARAVLQATLAWAAAGAP